MIAIGLLARAARQTGTRDYKDLRSRDPAVPWGASSPEIGGESRRRRATGRRM